MKLVNPQGRMVDDITNQANFGCACFSNIYLQSSASEHQPSCTCQCSYGTENSTANKCIDTAR